MKSFVLIFGGVGAILLVIAGFLYFQEQNFLSKSEEATGKVTDFDLSTDSDSGNSFCPVIEFTTKSGQPVEYHGNVCSSPPGYKIGAAVDVVYDPQNPENVQMKSFWSEYLASFILGAVGLPFFLIGLGSFVTIKRNA
jgi:hypothetical protein